jgi:3-deoxy-7-phosphoheptulonate synthase
VHEASRAPFYASHEALHLLYEQAQTRYIERWGRWYNLSTHLPWIGMRTARLGGAHVEYCRGISNPVGVKVGPAMDRAWLQGLCEALNPGREPGRLVLIHRLGAAQVEARLPAMIEAVRRPACWCLGLRPVHGNTETTSTGVKTGAENIVAELESAFRVHRQAGKATRWRVISDGARTGPSTGGAGWTATCRATTARR